MIEPIFFGQLAKDPENPVKIQEIQTLEIRSGVNFVLVKDPDFNI